MIQQASTLHTIFDFRGVVGGVTIGEHSVQPTNNPDITLGAILHNYGGTLPMFLVHWRDIQIKHPCCLAEDDHHGFEGVASEK